ncbi:MAG: Uma2 family endonuclease [Thermomicrobiales bacterium]
MAITQHRLTIADYEAFVQSGIEGQWELHDGVLVEKPGMTFEHGDIAFEIGHLLRLQLPRHAYRVQLESRVRRPPATVFRPDVMVFPTHDADPFRNQPGRLMILPDPLPLVVEVWSRSTGDYDIAAKLPIYQQRGDAEIWLVHPYDRTITAWRRQEDGSYTVTVFDHGVISPVALPGVAFDLADLFVD